MNVQSQYSVPVDFEDFLFLAASEIAITVAPPWGNCLPAPLASMRTINLTSLSERTAKYKNDDVACSVDH